MGMRDRLMRLDDRVLGERRSRRVRPRGLGSSLLLFAIVSTASSVVIGLRDGFGAVSANLTLAAVFAVVGIARLVVDLRREPPPPGTGAVRWLARDLEPLWRTRVGRVSLVGVALLFVVLVVDTVGDLDLPVLPIGVVFGLGVFALDRRARALRGEDAG